MCFTTEHVQKTKEHVQPLVVLVGHELWLQDISCTKAHLTEGYDIDISLTIYMLPTVWSQSCLIHTHAIRANFKENGSWLMRSQFNVSNYQIVSFHNPFYFLDWLFLIPCLFVFLAQLEKTIKIHHHAVCRARDKFWIYNLYGKAKFNGSCWFIKIYSKIKLNL